MKVAVLLFAKARDLAQKDMVELHVETGATIADVSAALLDSVESLKQSDLSLLWAINNAFADEGSTVSATDEIACFPPVSGG